MNCEGNKTNLSFMYAPFMGLVVMNLLSEGMQFYSKFQEILKNFRDNCSDFAFARKTEKEDLIRYLYFYNPLSFLIVMLKQL